MHAHTECCELREAARRVVWLRAEQRLGAHSHTVDCERAAELIDVSLLHYSVLSRAWPRVLQAKGSEAAGEARLAFKEKKVVADMVTLQRQCRRGRRREGGWLGRVEGGEGGKRMLRGWGCR